MSDVRAGHRVPQADFPLPEPLIAPRVSQLADQIDKAFPRTEPLMLIGLLRACFIFMADLSREIKRPLEVEFVSARSYSGNKSSGTVHIDRDSAAKLDVGGKHIVLVDTMLDYGLTLHAVVSMFKERDVRSLSTCVLLRKPHSPREIVPREFVGFDVPNVYVVGYGLDSNGGHRNQRFISAVG